MIQNFKKFSALLVHRTESFIKTDLVYFLKGGFWINSNYIINSFFFLILSILFANFVSKDIFGIYKYIISITAIAGVFSLTGMNVAVMRAVAQGFDGIFKKSLIEQFKWSWPQFFFCFLWSLLSVPK